MEMWRKDDCQTNMDMAIIVMESLTPVKGLECHGKAIPNVR